MRRLNIALVDYIILTRRVLIIAIVKTTFLNIRVLIKIVAKIVVVKRAPIIARVINGAYPV